MISIRNKKLVIAILLTLIILFGWFLNKVEEYNDYWEGVRYDGVDLEKYPIDARVSTLLMSGLHGDGEDNDANFWGQICLFYNFSYCIDLTQNFSVQMSLRSVDNEDRKKRYKSNIVDYKFITEDKTLPVEEKSCYLIYYKTQDDMQLHKKEFLSNYESCKKYYIQHQPLFEEYETKVLKIFE